VVVGDAEAEASKVVGVCGFFGAIEDTHPPVVIVAGDVGRIPAGPPLVDVAEVGCACGLRRKGMARKQREEGRWVSPAAVFG
jgi:hypothetical protein